MPTFAQLGEPILRTLHGDVAERRWMKQCDQIVESVLGKLTMHVGLILPDANQAFALKLHHTNGGFAETLLQKNPNGEQKFIASRVLLAPPIGRWN